MLELAFRACVRTKICWPGTSGIHVKVLYEELAQFPVPSLQILVWKSMPLQSQEKVRHSISSTRADDCSVSLPLGSHKGLLGGKRLISPMTAGYLIL